MAKETMDEKTADNLYRFLPVMFRMQLFGTVLVFFGFVFYAIFGGGFDLTGDEVLGFRAVLIGLPVVFIPTLLTYMLYPMLKKQNLVPGLLLVSIMVLNVLLSIPILTMLFSLFLEVVDVLFS